MTHELILGDCMEQMKKIDMSKVDIIITDPPCGLGDKWSGGTWFTKNVYKDDKVEWDNEAPQEIMDYMLGLNKKMIVWCGNYFVLPPSRCWLVWSKINSMPTMADIELAWTNFDKPSKQYRSMRNGWNRQHPTEKPVGLMEWCILNFTKNGDTVLDPFMGSGTTGVACSKTNRNFVGIEINQSYFDIARKRIKFAEQQPTLEHLF